MFELTDDHRNRLTRRAFTSLPLEACGFILDCGRIIECNNVSETPFQNFQMAGDDLDRRINNDEFLRITAIWHTHPRGNRYPSKADLEAIKLGSIHPDWAYLIATVDNVFVYDTKDFAPQANTFWEKFITT